MDVDPVHDRQGEPWWAHSTIRPTASAGPSKTDSTVPSARLRTQPLTPSSSAVHAAGVAEEHALYVTGDDHTAPDHDGFTPETAAVKASASRTAAPPGSLLK